MRWFVLAFGFAFALGGCGRDRARGLDGDEPRRALSAYRLFREPMRLLQPNDGVLPYALNTALFSDHAEKQRHVWMPPGRSAEYRRDAVFEFPVGTILVKTFGYPRDPGDPGAGRRLLETRLLIRRTDRWLALPYVWNEAQTDAVLRLGGTELAVDMVEPDGTPHRLDYLVPNANMCAHCHNEPGHFAPIGPKARNLNRVFSYADGPDNQLTRWRAAGYLRGGPDPAQAPRAARFDDPESGSVAQRARAWLDVNCASCHSPGGRAGSSGTYYAATVTEPLRLGVRKPPVAAGRGTGGRKFGIVPGEPDASILLHRIESTDVGVAMPEIGRQLVPKAAVALLRQWIAALE